MQQQRKKTSLRQILQRFFLACEIALQPVLRSFPTYQLADWHRATEMGSAAAKLACKFVAVLVELLARV